MLCYIVAWRGVAGCGVAWRGEAVPRRGLYVVMASSRQCMYTWKVEQCDGVQKRVFYIFRNSPKKISNKLWNELKKQFTEVKS